MFLLQCPFLYSPIVGYLNVSLGSLIYPTKIFLSFEISHPMVLDVVLTKQETQYGEIFNFSPEKSKYLFEILHESKAIIL